jgi:hypothetical protein
MLGLCPLPDWAAITWSRRNAWLNDHHWGLAVMAILGTAVFQVNGTQIRHCKSKTYENSRYFNRYKTVSRSTIIPKQ